MLAWTELICWLSMPLVGSSRPVMVLVAVCRNPPPVGDPRNCVSASVWPLVAASNVLCCIEGQLSGGVGNCHPQRGQRGDAAGAAGIVGEALQGVGQLVDDALARQRHVGLARDCCPVRSWPCCMRSRNFASALPIAVGSAATVTVVAPVDSPVNCAVRPGASVTVSESLESGCPLRLYLASTPGEPMVVRRFCVAVVQLHGDRPQLIALQREPVCPAPHCSPRPLPWPARPPRIR